MANIWVKDFNGGLDTRRLPETTAGGVLLRARNGHINRGGEFEQRAAFVPEYELPLGTVGMFYDRDTVIVFGSAPAPVMPNGIGYQRLVHPAGADIPLSRVASADLYRGKPYVVGEFEDGGVFHYYDGALVTDWFDGRATARFSVLSGSNAPAAAATVSFTVRQGLADPLNQITSIVTGSTALITAPIPFTTNAATTAALAATAINAAAHPYTAVASGPILTITAPLGAAPNGVAAVYTAVEGGVSTPYASEFAGGVDAITARIDDIRINGVSIIGAPVAWAGTREATAEAVAAAVTAFASSPEYTATAILADVVLRAFDAGSDANGRTVTVLTTRVGVSPMEPTMAGGSDGDEGGVTRYQPGTYVQTIGQKMYATSGSVMHFSGIREPTKWTTDAVGAGFIDMSEENSGAEELKALAKYQNLLAVFADRTIQTWYIDPDPALNRQTQVLNNTGTASPRSVTAFGDTDIFYLDESGIRSLRARDSSNAAATSDIGIPIDALVTEELAFMTAEDRQNIIGLIEPVSGRFWLLMRDKAFVFSYFPGSKISAWSEYRMEYTDEDGEQISFEVTEAMAFRRRVYLRSGDRIFVFSGLSGDVHDATPAEGWLPYLDASDPTRRKQFTGVDAALRGIWELSAAWYTGDELAQDKVGIFTETTFDLNGRVPANNTATHVSLRFKSQGEGPHRLSSCVIHYEGKEKAE